MPIVGYTLLAAVILFVMGMYDSVMVKCPKCGKENEFQSKSGECLLDVYTLENCPNDVMVNVNRHSPCKCNCGFNYEVDIENRKAVISTDDFKKEAKEIIKSLIEEFDSGEVTLELRDRAVNLWRFL